MSFPSMQNDAAIVERISSISRADAVVAGLERVKCCRAKDSSGYIPHSLWMGSMLLQPFFTNSCSSPAMHDAPEIRNGVMKLALAVLWRSVAVVHLHDV